MSELAAGRETTTIPGDVWSWWQERRLGYNAALTAAGATAYLLTIVVHYAFGDPLWAAWQEALGRTIFLGATFLIVIGVANICYLVGPFAETVLRPADRDQFRRTAFRMGLWGSVALPFLFPLIDTSFLIGH